jgi:hypothetical protein
MECISPECFARSLNAREVNWVVLGLDLDRRQHHAVGLSRGAAAEAIDGELVAGVLARQRSRYADPGPCVRFRSW